MNEVIVFKLVDAALTAFQIGVAREDILMTAAKMEAEGATPQQVTEALVKMRDEAIAKAQAAVSG